MSLEGHQSIIGRLVLVCNYERWSSQLCMSCCTRTGLLPAAQAKTARLCTVACTMEQITSSSCDCTASQKQLNQVVSPAAAKTPICAMHTGHHNIDLLADMQ